VPQSSSRASGEFGPAEAEIQTIQKLAERAGMSRSTFDLKFKQTIGALPMEYLTRWRMLRAGDSLANSSDPISIIALSLGYESESAFSTAFKRVAAAMRPATVKTAIWRDDRPKLQSFGRCAARGGNCPVY
jgi:transcriptional regulator GlxA family with amidase domain